MLIESYDKYIDELSTLWQETFGDSEDYIKLLFSTLSSKDFHVFLKEQNGKIVSVLYLLNAHIKTENKVLDGFYLYAAATHKSYRGKGFMGELINEAKNFAVLKQKDFITLLPAEESLYNYYERFSFKPLMYRKYDVIKVEGKKDISTLSDFSKYFSLRRLINTESFQFYKKNVSKYAEKCFEFCGVKAYNTADFSFLYEEALGIIPELVCERKNYADALSKLKNMLPKGDFTVYSPFGKYKEKYGMIYFTNEDNKCESIYMNIAFD